MDTSDQERTCRLCCHIIDFDDWQVNPSVFRMLDGLWGPHTVNRFASSTNTQLGRFNSKFWCPGTEAVDTSTTNWSYDVNWLVTPYTYLAIQFSMPKLVTQEVLLPFWPGSLPIIGRLSVPTAVTWPASSTDGATRHFRQNY